MQDLIRRKRDGGALTFEEIQFIVAGAARQTISDAQLAAWLMAVWIRGLDRAELHALTTAMRFSGEVFDPSSLGKFAVDKHSTGGVGDKTSFLVAPIAAAAGLAVPMISGRALGHTGGTLDKLETIPGYRTLLSLTEFADVIRCCGCSIIGQTQTLVPADRVLYALRDHTGTVESPNLICASIMSKKLAAGLNGLMLDVKTGSGAFLTNPAEAEHLARLMVATGENAGTRTVALLTSMEEPLGRYSGNWLEVQESVDILQGRRHCMSADLIELSLILAGWMIHLGGKAETPEEGKLVADELLKSGAAYERFANMVRAQGGDARIFEHPSEFHQPVARVAVAADRDGYISAVDCTKIGWAVQRLGAGRTRPGEPVAAHAGIEMHAKIGARVEAGEPIATLFSNDALLLDEPKEMIRSAITFSEAPPKPHPLIRKIITFADID